MTTTIAVGGKGGVGKTTLSALLVQMLSKSGSVLAIDADPSSNLHLSLGLPLENSVGDIREDMSKQVKRGKFAQGLSKQDYLELKIQEALVESEGFDLLAMGRPEGPGCYCAANNMLRLVIDRLSSNYRFVVIDNEAGLEHVSRQTTRDVDFLLLVSDPSMKGVLTAVRLKELIKELRTSIGRIGLIMNRLNGSLSPELAEVVSRAELEIVGNLPTEPEMLFLDAKGVPLSQLAENSPLRAEVRNIAEKLGLPVMIGKQ